VPAQDGLDNQHMDVMSYVRPDEAREQP
jgi:hypothetical protein